MNASPSLRESFAAAHPAAFFLDAGDPEGLSAYLTRLGWLASGETVLESGEAGEGNMNCALRVKTDRRSFIVKQGRPWVEKYPSIAAPWGRSSVEAAFYRRIAANAELADRMPRLIGEDAASQIVALEDLGDASDFTFAYKGRRIRADELELFVDYLKRLHLLPVENALRTSFANREMRRLNHEHIFRLPFARENGLELDRITPGLARAAERLKTDRDCVREIAVLGKRYLDDGETLLHGDYYPGSWLRTAAGVRVIDPEFCFLGPAEFDLGVFAAHLLLSDRGEEPIGKIFDRYQPSDRLDKELALRFAGVEILRRLMGVAQLPLARNLEWKGRLLERARRLVLHGR